MLNVLRSTFLTVALFSVASQCTSNGCKTYNDLDCQFPFDFGGASHDGCVSNADGTVRRCLATDKRGRSSLYQCNDDCPNSGTNICKTIDGVYCQFPFVFGTTTHEGCIDGAFGKKYCLLGSGVSKLHQCSIDGCHKSTSIGCNTINGLGCSIPFEYGNTTYHGCMGKSGKYFCPAVNEDGFSNFYECADDCPKIASNGCKTKNGLDCQIPFAFGTTTHDGCVNGASGKYFCPAVDEHGTSKLDECADDCPKSASDGCKTIDGQNCKLPFDHGDVTHNGCMDDSGKFVCPAVDEDGNTNFHECADGCPRSATSNGCKTTNGLNCQLPFKFGGVNFDSCMGVASGKYYCPAVDEFGFTNYYECAANCPKSAYRHTCKTYYSGLDCIFPFEDGRISHDGCMGNYFFKFCKATDKDGETKLLPCALNCPKSSKGR